MNKKAKEVLIEWLNRLSQITIVAFILTPFAVEKASPLLLILGLIVSGGALLMAIKIASTIEED
jgi:hypothetical protein